MIKLLFLGDVMPGGVLPYQDEFITREVQQFIGGYDLRVGTMETAIGDNLPFDEVKMRGRMNIIHCRTEDLSRVDMLDLNVVSLANNHVYDLGAEGLRTTIEELDRRGIKHCGAGMNIKEAAKPAVVTIKGKTLAFLAYCQYGSDYLGYVPLADDNNPGLNPLNIEKCEEEIRAAKKKYDYVFVLPHWGQEYRHFPLPEMVKNARRMVLAGADGVFGSHTHQIEPLITYKGKPIAFSMGNFLFPDYYMKPPRPLWYPPKDYDTSGIDRFNYYPDHIDAPCVSVWRQVSRFGMMVECSVSDANKVEAQYELSYLDTNNVITMGTDPLDLRKRMAWMGVVAKMPGFGLLRRSYYSRKNIVRRGYHFLKRHLKRTLNK